MWTIELLASRKDLRRGAYHGGFEWIRLAGRKVSSLACGPLVDFPTYTSWRDPVLCGGSLCERARYLLERGTLRRTFLKQPSILQARRERQCLPSPFLRSSPFSPSKCAEPRDHLTVLAIQTALTVEGVALLLVLDKLTKTLCVTRLARPVLPSVRRISPSV